MAEELEQTFCPGQIVSCKTCFEQSLEGEVVAYDYERRVLVIKSPSTSQTGHHDVHLINLNCVGDVEIKKEAKNGAQPTNLAKVNLNKVDARVHEATAERNAICKAFEEGATEEGIRLYQSLVKTLTRDVCWKGKDIFVNQCVLIRPPYREDNCSLLNENVKSNEKTIAYVQQLVKKHWTDAPTRQQNGNTFSPDSPNDSRKTF